MSNLTRREFLLGASGLLMNSYLLGCQKRGQAVRGSTAAEQAVDAARRFAGTTLNVGWETGPQAQDLLRFSGPRWEKLTGIRINTVELGLPTDAFARILEEHRAGTSALDCASIAPSWMPDLLQARALEPLDTLSARYGFTKDLDDYLPKYRNLGVWNGRYYGFFDDGDVLLLFFRRDLFENEAIKEQFAKARGRPLGDPRTFDWRQFLEAARFFTDTYAPRLFGMAPLNRDQFWAWFQAYLRANGGRFFDPDTMNPEINSAAGLKTLEDLLALQGSMPPFTDHVSNDPTLATYLSGRSAMAGFWPPMGRWAEGYGLKSREFGGLPESRIAGKTGYALLPGGITELAVGFMLAVLSHSRQKEAAYLFLQWLASREVSLQRVMLPYALRDPYRKSHMRSAAFRALWPSAPRYLEILEKGADAALLDLTIPGAIEYEESFFLAMTDVRLGLAPRKALDRMAASWNEITDRRGRGRQRTAYAEFLEKPGAMPAGTGERAVAP